MMPASSTEPIVGASVCASGSQVWNGHIGTFTANPSPTAPKTTSWNVSVNPPEAAYPWSATMSNVCTPPPISELKYIARNPSNMKIDPNSAYRKNLIEAYSRFALPQMP